MSSSDGGLRGFFPVRPGGCLVVEGAGPEASVQDADEPVCQPPERIVVLDAFGAELVVAGAGAGRGVQGGEGLGHEGVHEPVVVNEPGRDDFLLARGAGDRAGCGVVPAGLAVGVPVGVDRKSTRLNSSHQIISYAVFCLKKKMRTMERKAKTPAEYLITSLDL